MNSKKSIFYYVSWLVSASTILVSFQNCSQSNMSPIDPVAKAAVIDGSDVLEGSDNPVNPPITTNPENPPAESIETSTLSIPVQRSCSDRRMKSTNGVGIYNASNLSAQIKVDGEVLCVNNNFQLLKSSMMKENPSIEFENCDLTSNDKQSAQIHLFYTSTSRFGNSEQVSLLLNNMQDQSFPGTTNSPNKGTRLTYTTEDLESAILSQSVLFYKNNKRVQNTEEEGVEDWEEHCDNTHSPLVVDMRSIGDITGVSLSAPQDGTYFDILGLNSTPAPYTPKLISWIYNPKYQFVVLPDENNQVHGIDQLFGDNTLGPDGQFANDGFHALAKYDGTDAKGLKQINEPDGLIDENDAVYSKLRLWADYNQDGISQAHELKSLDESGLAVIDLDFDPNFYERDQYGNETKYKSVVKLKNNEYRLIFDVWFKVDEDIQGQKPQRGLASQ